MSHIHTYFLYFVILDSNISKLLYTIVFIPLFQLLSKNFQDIFNSREKQGRKRPLDTPKRMIERREREGKREKER